VSGRNQLTGLTNKQQAFVDEYLVDLNATQAVIRAGYSSKHADKLAHEVLHHPRVSAAVRTALAERSRRTGVNADRVIAELAKIAYANLEDVVNLDTGTFVEGTNRDDTAAIVSLKVRNIRDGGIEREFRLHDKMKALELLGRHHGMFDDKLKISIDAGSDLTSGDMVRQAGEDLARIRAARAKEGVR
jgi:phage terminase small subunit